MLTEAGQYDGSQFVELPGGISPPVGNPCGHPWRRDMQKAIVRQALELLENAGAPRTTVKASYSWKADDPDWRSRYGRVDPAERERLLAIGEERRRQRAERIAATAVRRGDA